MNTALRRWRNVAVVCSCFAFVCAGCSDDATQSDPVNTDILDGGRVPDEQRAAFVDGNVDTNEYQEAFGRFRDCANTSESLVVDIQTDPVSGFIGYGVKGELSAPGTSNGSHLDDCYQRYFSYIEATWQTTDPGALESVIQSNMDFYHEAVQPCLIANGLEAPDDVVPGTEEFSDLSNQFLELDAAGKC